MRWSLQAKASVGLGLVLAISVAVGIKSYRQARPWNATLWVSVLTDVVCLLAFLAFLIHRDVTGRNRAEQAWRESEERFRQISENLRDVLWVITPGDPHSLFVSSAYEKITGRSARSLYDHPLALLDMIHPEDRGRAKEALLAQSRGEIESAVECRIVRPDGTIRWLCSRGFPVRRESGEVYLVVGIAEDITERRHAEEALRHSEEQLRLVVEGMRDTAIFVLDPAGKVATWNSGAKRIMGYRNEEIIGKHFSCLYSPEEAEGHRPERVLEKALSEGRFEEEGWRVRKDGSRFWANTTTTPLRDQAGKLQGFGRVTRDVTERMLVEEALRESERRYRLLFERNLAGVCLTAPDGRIVNCNDAFAQIFGCDSRAELLTHTVWDLYFDSSERNAVRVKLKGVGSFSGVEFRARRKDGSPVWLLGSMALIPSEDGTQYLTQGTIIDITRRKEAEAVSQALLRIGGKLNATLDVDELMDSLVLEAIGLANAESGCSGLRTPEGLVCHRVMHRSQTVALEYCWPPGHGSPGRVLVTKTPYVSNDVKIDGQVVRELCDRFEIRSLITTPLLDSRGEVLGFFEIYNKRDGSDFTSADQKNLLAVAHTASVAIQKALAYRQVSQAEEKLSHLSGRLLRSQDEERSRIARELHDSTVQSLAALVINLTRLDDSTVGLESALRDTVSDSLALAEQCAREVRTLSYLLHPPLLDELGLGPALRQYVEGFVQRSGIRVDLNLPVGLGRLPREVATTLFRIVQEGLTNIHKHSGSPRAAIRLAQSNGELALEVRDRGRGIPPEALDSLNCSFQGLGLGITGMRERVRQLGGSLEIESGADGTTVKATLPLRGSDL